MDINALRWATQWIALVASNAYLGFFKTKQVYQGSLKGACVPFLNCHSCPSAFFSCPIGIMQHFMTLHQIPFMLLGFLAAVGASVGAAACGWLCPFGFLQDLMHRIKSFKIRIPSELSGLRYLSLIFLVLLIPYLTQETWFSKICPAGTLQAALPWVLWNPVIPVYGEPAVAPTAIGWLFGAKVLILLLFLGLFVMSKRPFCRMACPLGAIMGIFNKISLLRLKVATEHCKDCGKCVASCPVDICVGSDANATTCVRCLKCLDCEHVRLEVGAFGQTSEVRVPRLPARLKPVFKKAVDGS
ncbi:MAG: 4Fe-4S binding protein [Candidatus Omnitrophica bacterium]|nr:4Fe-4S binding protein [Candidatus Omnitrophota bacterium]